MGRQLKYKCARRMKDCIDKYFLDCDDNKRPYSICKLALHLGIARETLLQYQKKDKYSDIIKEAKQRVEAFVEETLLSGKSQAGSIFWLKNHGWSDKQEITVEDVTKLSKDQLISKITSLQNIKPIKPAIESADKQASN